MCIARLLIHHNDNTPVLFLHQVQINSHTYTYAHVFLEKSNVRNVEIKIISLCTALQLTTSQVYT